jgi:hypothetical protein
LVAALEEEMSEARGGPAPGGPRPGPAPGPRESQEGR